MGGRIVKSARCQMKRGETCSQFGVPGVGRTRRVREKGVLPKGTHENNAVITRHEFAEATVPAENTRVSVSTIESEGCSAIFGVSAGERLCSGPPLYDSYNCNRWNDVFINNPARPWEFYIFPGSIRSTVDNRRIIFTP